MSAREKFDSIWYWKLEMSLTNEESESTDAVQVATVLGPLWNSREQLYRWASRLHYTTLQSSPTGVFSVPRKPKHQIKVLNTWPQYLQFHWNIKRLVIFFCYSFSKTWKDEGCSYRNWLGRIEVGVIVFGAIIEFLKTTKWETFSTMAKTILVLHVINFSHSPTITLTFKKQAYGFNS